MKKIRVIPLLILLLFLIIIFAGFNFWLHWQKHTDPSLSDAEMALPAAPLTPQTMSLEQKQQLIEQARNDAIAAARAIGSEEETISRFGEQAVEAAKAAVNRPASVIVAP